MRSKIITSAAACAAIVTALLAKPWSRRPTDQASGAEQLTGKAADSSTCPTCCKPGSSCKKHAS